MAASAPTAVAIIGYGSSARTFHIPFILSLPDVFHLHTIQQRPESKSGPPASTHHPNVRVAPTLDSVFEGENGDGHGALPPRSLVIITTANETHNEFALQAMKHGHHVVVEKPAALTLPEALALKQTSEAEGVVCCAYQNRRLDNDFLTLRALLSPPRNDPSQPSAIGQPTLVESRFDRYRPLAKGGWREEVGPEKGGGMLWDLGAHLVDQALALFGPPEKITAFAYSARGQLPEHVDDDFLVHLHYPTTAPLPPDSEAPLPGTRIAGPRVTLGASCLSAHTDAEQARWKVEGTRGSFFKTGTDPQENQLKAGWTPRSHPEAFGVYASDSPRALTVARLTTSTVASAAASAAAPSSATGGAPKQPELASTDIPMLPGRYVDYYANVGQTIWAIEAARKGKEGEDGDAKEEIEKIKQEMLLVKIDQTVDVTKCILLARKSAKEERTVKWSEDL